jgi:hypothetical protein
MHASLRSISIRTHIHPPLTGYALVEEDKHCSNLISANTFNGGSIWTGTLAECMQIIVDNHSNGCNSNFFFHWDKTYNYCGCPTDNCDARTTDTNWNIYQIQGSHRTHARAHALSRIRTHQPHTHTHTHKRTHITNTTTSTSTSTSTTITTSTITTTTHYYYFTTTTTTTTITYYYFLTITTTNYC